MDTEYLATNYPTELLTAFDAGCDLSEPLAESLKIRARTSPDRVLYTFLDDRGNEVSSLTVAQVDRAARTIAATLQATPNLVPGNRAMLCFPPGLEFTTAFWGCQYAGIVGTAIYPPHPAMLAKDLPRFNRMAEDADAKTILTTQKYFDAIVAKSKDQWIPNVVWHATDALDSSRADDYVDTVGAMDDVAFFQYSSGSTSDPKAVMVTHANIQAQLLLWLQMVAPTDTMISWLPPFHDMGLVVFTITPCAIGAHCISMDPLSFIKDPTIWLRTVTKYKGTHICAPNFAYSLAARKTSQDVVATLELNTLKMCTTAAEPIRAETLHEFKQKFAPAGFDAKTFACGYGMAETTLSISGNYTTIRILEPTILNVQKKLLEKNTVELATLDQPTEETTLIVSCGTLAPTFEVVVVEPVTSKVLNENEVGELWIQSPSVAKGYWNRDQLNKEVFEATIESRDGVWLRSGDMGFLSRGELYITGRLKDLIIIRGRNIYPQDIELSVELAHRQVRPGCVAAFSIESMCHEESIVVVAELQVDLKEDLVALTTIGHDIASAINSDHRLPCDAVVLVKPRSIPKTTSGKIQRKATKIKYEAGTLAVQFVYLESNKSEAQLACGIPDDKVAICTFETEKEAQLAQVWVDVLKLAANQVHRESSIFTLGGDSLSIMQVAAECEKRGIHVTASSMYDEPVLWRAAQAMVAPSNNWPAVAIPHTILEEIHQHWPSESNQVYPVSPLQAGMISATIQKRDSYLMQIPLLMEKTFNAEKLARAFQAVVERHDTLRTTFETSTAGVFQIIRQNIRDLVVDYVKYPTIDAFLEVDRDRGFEIGDRYFVRLTLVLSNDSQYAVLTIHHALYDGWTLSLVTSDLLDALQDKPLEARPSFCTVVDYIEAQDTDATAAFWRSYLSKYSPCPLTLSGHKDEAEQEKEPLNLTSQVSLDEIKAAAKRVGASPAEFNKVAWAITVRKYTRQDDVVFGQVLANRDIPVKGADRILGPLINTVPYRVTLDASKPLQTIFDDVQATRGAISTHSYAGLIDIKRWSGLEGELFDTLFVYQQLPDVPQIESGYGLKVVDQTGSPFSYEYSLEIFVVPTNSSTSLKALYKPGVLSRSQAQWMLVEFDHTLTQLCDLAQHDMDKAMDVASLFDLSPEQTHFIETVSVGPTSPLPYELLHHAFEKRAKSHPSSPAIEFEGRSISYGDLDARSDSIAATLIDMGVKVGSRVAVIMDRCLEFPMGLLASLKAGAAIMPLDASFPVNRITYMLLDASVNIVVTTKRHLEHVRAANSMIGFVVVDLDERMDSNISRKCSLQIATSSNEAFIVYTSGSTGKPKGIPVTHMSAVNAVQSWSKEANIAEGLRVLQFMAIGFDVCEWEIWGTLSHGSCLVLRGDKNLSSLATVDVLICTPTALQQLGHPTLLPQLSTVAVIGEACPSSLKDLWSTYVAFVNMYGPAECAILTHLSILAPNSCVNIGKPIHNVAGYVLDNHRYVVPIGVVGEIYLSGMCVSPGYINLPEQTVERFLPNPFVGGEQHMFRTGDLGRILPNGSFEVLGREDSQVKLKGYRIELDEVAGAMMQHPQVVTSAALVKDKTHLVGYFSPASVDSDELQEMVASFLPPYMVPAVWVGLDVMPQNTNGKIDKKALEALDVVVDAEALTTESEHRMAAVWAHVLSVDVCEIGRRTSFFALGGDSMSAIKVVAACNADGMSITTAQLLKAPVLWRAASLTHEGTRDVWPSISMDDAMLVEIEKEWCATLDLGEYTVYPVSPLQAGMIFATMQKRDSYLLQIPLVMEGTFDAEKLSRAFRSVVERHDTLRTTFVSSTAGVFQIIRHDIRSLAVDRVEYSSIDAFLEVDRDRGFKIGDRYFVRLTLVQSNGNQYGVLTIHHALYDGWTLSLVTSDLLGALQDKPFAARPRFCTVVDYIEAQDRNATGAFWRSYLSGYSPCPLALSSHDDDAQHEKEPLSLASKVSLGEIKAAAKRVGVSPAEFNKIAWAITVRKYTRQDDVVFGQVLANRDIPVKDADSILGPLINTVPYRVTLDASKPLQTIFDDVQATRGAISTHSYAGLIDIKRWSGLEGELFDTLFVYQQLPDIPQIESGSGLQVVGRSVSPYSHEYSIELIVVPTANGVSMQALYKHGVVSRCQARWVLVEFDHTLTQLCDLAQHDMDKAMDVASLFDLSPEQTHFIETVSVGPTSPLPYELLHHAFEKRAKSHPSSPAIEFEGR
ncbi:hypothetical protein As57867_015648, partial [Aphanomyces stellatus]